MNLAINEGKMRIGSKISAGDYNFDVMNEIVYLCQPDVNLDIKRRISLANRCYYAAVGN